MSDLELLAEYQRSRSDEAFRGLIDRYLGLVYSSCWRQLRDRHWAEDATQAVFVLLSQKAGSIRGAHLAGWLLTTARFTCLRIKKTELRRHRRETAVAMREADVAAEAEDAELLDLLDDGLTRLRVSDREAIALRFGRGQGMREVGEALGISEEAARKRVDRGVEKLRGYFARRGIVTASEALPVILGRQMSGAALSAEARTAVTHGILQACHGGTGITWLVKGTNMMMQITRVKLAATVFLIAVTVLTAGWRSVAWVMADGESAVNPPVAPAAPVDPAEATYQACRQVLVTMIDAHDHDDAAGLLAQIYVSPSADPLIARILPTLVDIDLSVYRAQQAAIARFGAHAVGVRWYWTTTVVTLEDLLTRIDRRRTAINGDAAWISPAPPFFPPQGIWLDAPIYFRNDNGVWKVDLSRTLKFTYQFRRRIPVQGETQEQAMMAGEKGVLDQVNSITQDINSGKIASVGELQKRLDGVPIGLALMYSVANVNIVPR